MNRNPIESKARSLIKSISWRILGTIITALGAFLLTHSLSISFYVSAAEFFGKIILFYFHERLWQNIPFGSSMTNKQVSHES